MAKGIHVEHPQSGSSISMAQSSVKTKDITGGSEEKGKEIRTTVDMPVKMHKAMRRLLLEEEMNMKQYLLRLIEKDMENRGVVF